MTRFSGAERVDNFFAVFSASVVVSASMFCMRCLIIIIIIEVIYINRERRILVPVSHRIFVRVPVAAMKIPGALCARYKLQSTAATNLRV